MKRILSMVLATCLLASLIVALPVDNVSAATTISDNDLFTKYSRYLSNGEMDEALTKAEEAYYAVINSYSDADEVVAKAVTILDEGVSIAFRESLAELGITENYYDSCAKEAAKKYMQSVLQNENVLEEATKKVQNAYKGIKTLYSATASVEKEQLLEELTKIATENDIGISAETLDEYIENAYESKTLTKNLEAIGAVGDLWKYVVEFSELHAIEMTTLNTIMNELEASGQSYSDLYVGLSILKKDIEKDDFYILEKYATETVINLLSEFVDEMISNVTGSVHLALIKCCISIFCDYIYVDAKAGELIEATMQTSFVSSLEICITNHMLKFGKDSVTTEDIEKYETLYGAYLSAYVSVLEGCYDISKISDKFGLGGDCKVWADEIKYTYTYDYYIEMCKEEVIHDIKNGELSSKTGESNISDDLNEATIKERLERIFKLYPSGDRWVGNFMGTKSSLGFACKIFNHIFDKTMCKRVENKYQYILTNNMNVRLIGRLEAEGVTEDALKELFSNVRIGDVVITSGQYDDLHAMIVVDMGETGPIVYDVDSVYGPAKTAEEYTYLIQKYEFPYSKMADAFSKNGVYRTKSGISVYRAIRKVNTTNSGTSLENEEYDDSVNYIIKDGVLTGYTGTRSTINIPDGVTKIQSDCFKDNENIRSVYMPDTVTEIETRAFYRCTNLRHIDLSRSLNKIGSEAFNLCVSLAGINIPSTVTRIEYQTFSNCDALAIVRIPSGVTYIAGWAFYGCDNLIRVHISDSVTEISDIAFEQCEKIEEFIVSEDNENYSTKGGNLFNKDRTTLVRYCSGKDLEYYSIPEDVTRIEAYAFENSGVLKKVHIPNGVTSIGESAFEYCSSLQEVFVPESVTDIGPSAFSSCGKLVDVTIPKGVTCINDNTFATCSSLEEINIPNGVTQIGNGAFSSCTKLIDIAIPDSVTKIGSGAFDGSGYHRTTANWEDNMLYAGKYLISVNNNISGICSIKAGTKYIEDGAFIYCAKLTKVIMPESLICISDGAFSACTGLTEVVIPEGVTYISANAFYGCTGLSDIDIPDSVTCIKAGAFSSCKKLTDISLPDKVESIGTGAFSGCEGLTQIILPDGVKDIGVSAFENCTNLYNIKIPENVINVGGSAFKNTAYYNDSDKWEDGALYIGKCLIIGNKNKGIIKEGTKTIAASAFYWSTFTNITIPNSVNVIGDGAFYWCNLSSVVIPDGVTYIGYQAFFWSELKSVIMSDSVKYIGERAFDWCDRLRDIYYYGSEEEWSEINFEGEKTYLNDITIHYNGEDIPPAQIDSFYEIYNGSTASVYLTVSNLIGDATIYVGSYDKNGRLLEIQELSLINGQASGTFNTEDVVKYKAFVWKDNKPLAKIKEYTI